MKNLLMMTAVLAVTSAFAECDKKTVAKIADEHKIIREDTFVGYDRVVFDFEGHEAVLNGCANLDKYVA